MKKIIMALAISFIVSVVITSMVYAQMAGKEWEKTITLPSGEVILDMSGEWDLLSEYYGRWSQFNPHKDILTFTQEGNTFTAVRQIGFYSQPKGYEAIKGELDKDGFKSVYRYCTEGPKPSDKWIWEPCTWEISENGNKVVFDYVDRVKMIITRR
jgi:hypothetical protein